MMRSAQSGNDKAELIRGQQSGSAPSARKDTFDSSATLLLQYAPLYHTIDMTRYHTLTEATNFGCVGGVGGYIDRGRRSSAGEMVAQPAWEDIHVRRGT